MVLLWPWMIGLAITGLFSGIAYQVFLMERRQNSNKNKAFARLEKDKRILRGKQKDMESQIRHDSRRARANWEKDKKKKKSLVLNQITTSTNQDTLWE